MILDDSVTENDEIKHYVQRKLDGEDFSSIRKELIARGYSEGKVASLMREIEDSVMESYERRTFRIHPVMIAGFSLALVGITLMIFQKTGILSLGALFGGLTLLVAQRQRRAGTIERSKWNRR